MRINEIAVVMFVPKGLLITVLKLQKIEILKLQKIEILKLQKIGVLRLPKIEVLILQKNWSYETFPIENFLNILFQKATFPNSKTLKKSWLEVRKKWYLVVFSKALFMQFWYFQKTLFQNVNYACVLKP